jgi:hypothetical protein
MIPDMLRKNAFILISVFDRAAPDSCLGRFFSAGDGIGREGLREMRKRGIDQSFSLWEQLRLPGGSGIIFPRNRRKDAKENESI